MSIDPEVKGDYRPMPRSFKDLGLPEIFLANLLLRHAFFMDVFYLWDLSGTPKTLWQYPDLAS